MVFDISDKDIKEVDIVDNLLGIQVCIDTDEVVVDDNQEVILFEENEVVEIVVVVDEKKVGLIEVNLVYNNEIAIYREEKNRMNFFIYCKKVIKVLVYIEAKNFQKIEGI